MTATSTGMTYRRAIVSVLVSVALDFSTPRTIVAQNEAKESGFTLKDIENAWRSRQDRVASLSLEWRTTRLLAKGAVVREESKTKLGFLSPFPKDDVELNLWHSLLVANGCLRYIEHGQYWDSDKDAFAEGEARTIWNGTEGREYFALSGEDFKEGRITGETTIIANASAGPPLLAIWPMVPRLGNLKIEKYSLSAQTATIDGQECAILRKEAGGTLWNEIWVDIDRRFLILRALSRKDQTVVNQVDIVYEGVGSDAWRPARWEWNTLYRDGSLKENSRSEVVEYRESPEVAADAFRVDFPPATFFVDQRNSDEVRFIVREDGTSRKVLDEEFYGGVPKQTLMNTEPGEVWRKGSMLRRVVAGLVGLSLLAVVALVALWRR